VTTDTDLDGGEKLVEGASAKKVDVLAMRTGAREGVVVVGCPVRLEEDVVTGKTQHLVAVATLGKVDGHGALGVGPVRGSDGESESGSKGTANVHGGVKVGNGAKKRWTNRPLVDGLAVFDVDIDDVEAREKIKNLVA
jgi:hypothetical protein